MYLLPYERDLNHGYQTDRHRSVRVRNAREMIDVFVVECVSTKHNEKQTTFYFVCFLDSLPKGIMFYLFKLKVFADEKLNMTQHGQNCRLPGWKKRGKRKKNVCFLSRFFFQKVIFCVSIKVCTV